MRFVICLIAAAALIWPAVAAAERIVWTLSKPRGLPYLVGVPDESEVDFEFWARCRPDGMIDVGLGAESHVGKGKGERVSLTLTSAGRTVEVEGVSRASANAQMTGGVELQARVTRDDKLFVLLKSGQPIAVTEPIKPLKWDVRGLKAKVEAFLRDCGKK